jgi:hypothetical protein
VGGQGLWEVCLVSQNKDGHAKSCNQVQTLDGYQEISHRLQTIRDTGRKKDASGESGTRGAGPRCDVCKRGCRPQSGSTDTSAKGKDGERAGERGGVEGCAHLHTALQCTRFCVWINGCQRHTVPHLFHGVFSVMRSGAAASTTSTIHVASLYRGSVKRRVVGVEIWGDHCKTDRATPPTTTFSTTIPMVGTSVTTSEPLGPANLYNIAERPESVRPKMATRCVGAEAKSPIGAASPRCFRNSQRDARFLVCV